MSNSGEPPRKKSKVSNESFCEDATEFYEYSDRVILVGKRKFHVDSKDLVSKSEYFRIMFQSDFKEKDEKIVELKEINAKNFEQFLIILRKPEEFKATKCKLIDLIATLAYFQVTEPIKTILRDANNFNKIPKKDLLELANTFGLTDITEMVEEWYLANSKKGNHAIKYQQLKDSVEYGMKRLETKLLNFFSEDNLKSGKSELETIMDEVLEDNSVLGKKVYEAVKTSVFEVFTRDDQSSILHAFTEKMTEIQFELVKEQVEELILNSLKTKKQDYIVERFWSCVKPIHFQKMEKLKDLVTEHFKKAFPSYNCQFLMISSAQQFGLDNFMVFAIDYLSANFRKTHCYKTIDIALKHNLDPLKNFLKTYLRKNYARLSSDSKRKMECGQEIKNFILKAIQ